MLQAVGPVAVTSLLLGSGLKDLISSDVQPDPNNPINPEAQMEYNMAAIQVCATYTAGFDVSCTTTSLQQSARYTARLFWYIDGALSLGVLSIASEMLSHALISTA